MRTISRLLCSSILTGSLSLTLASVSPAQIIDPRLWTTDGYVNALALEGNTLYVGGMFEYVGPNTGSFAALDSVGCAPRAGWPLVNGPVRAVAFDGAGGWYIGGDFTQVAGLTRSRLAHIRADGTLDAWDPGADHPVRSLVMCNGLVFAGGDFTTIGGRSRLHVAALDATTGIATNWNPGVSGIVYSLAANGGFIYVGGDFGSAGGKERSHIAALDIATGIASDWNPGVSGRVYTICVDRGTVYIGGAFGFAGGRTRSGIAALDASTGAATDWDPSATNGAGLTYVSVLLVNADVVYVGGMFTSIGGQARANIAALDVLSGTATSWNPVANDEVFTIQLRGTTAYVGGRFSVIGGQTRRYVAALDVGTGLPTSWDSQAGSHVYAIAADGGTVFAGGGFSSIGGRARKNIAALDTGTGAATAWNPGASGGVFALAAHGSTLYAGGVFLSIGGQARRMIAAIDAGTGAATSWDPNSNGPVYALAAASGRVYAGGLFTTIGGQSRSGFAVVDSSTGAVLPSAQPYPSGSVHALAIRNGRLYVGGSFTEFGAPRTNLAVVDLASNWPFPWNPNPNAVVQALLVGDGVVYVGGQFTAIGGRARNRVAAVDTATGIATDWDPDANDAVIGLARSDGEVYAGGVFTIIGGQSRTSLAAMDGIVGDVAPWSVALGYGSYRPQVLSLAADGERVYVGGQLTSVGGQARSGLAGALPAASSPPSISVLSPDGGESLVVRTVHRMTWSATAVAPGVRSIDLYLSRGGPTGPWELLAGGAANTGYFDWTITGPAVSGAAYLRVDARDWAGNVATSISDAGFSIVIDPTSVPGPGGWRAVELDAPAPNPVRTTATVRFAVPRPCAVRIEVLDVAGREMARLADGEHLVGTYRVALDATEWGPGLYFLRLRGPGIELLRRVVVVR